MNIIRLLILLAVLAIGLVVGSLNSQPIVIDFGAAVIDTTSGVAIMVAALAGALLGGGTVFATSVIPLHARLRRASRAQQAGISTSSPHTQEGH